MRYQHGYGYHATSNWGEGDQVSEWGEGDVVYIPAHCPAFDAGRIPHAWSDHPELSQRGGKYRVVQVFSIGEGPEWYYRVAPIVGRTTMFGENSDRIHVIPGQCDYTDGWLLIERARCKEKAA